MRTGRLYVKAPVCIFPCTEKTSHEDILLSGEITSYGKALHFVCEVEGENEPKVRKKIQLDPPLSCDCISSPLWAELGSGLWALFTSTYYK